MTVVSGFLRAAGPPGTYQEVDGWAMSAFFVPVEAPGRTLIGWGSW